MIQSLSCTVVSLQSLGRQKTVYLDILMFMLVIFERNIFQKLGLSVDYQKDCFEDLLSIQSDMFWLSSRTHQVSLPFRNLCLFSCMIYVSQQVVKHAKNICHFIVINITCLTSENNKVMKIWWQKLYKSFKLKY